MAETDNLKLALPASNEYVDVEVLNENFRKIDTSVLLALAAAAPYSSEQTYALGAYCTRGGKLYRCTTAISAAEVWTDAHWTETTMGAELVAISIALANKTPILQQIPIIYLTPENMNGIKEGTIALSKIGNMVMFTMNISPESGQVEYNKTYAVLPEGYRPIKNFTFPSDNGNYKSLYSEIDTAGNVRFYADTQCGFISAELMYFSV